TTTTYNADGQVLSTALKTAGGQLVQSSTATYDMAGRLAVSADVNGQSVTTSYDEANRVFQRTALVDGEARVTTYRYGAKGQAVWTQNPEGVWTKTEYDRKGQVKAIVVDPAHIPNSASGSLALDQLVVNPADGGGLALRTEFSYDSDGQTLTVIEGAGSASAKTTRYLYDLEGRRTQEIVDPAGLNLTTAYVYDA